METDDEKSLREDLEYRLDEIDSRLEGIERLLEGKSDDRNDNGLKGDVADHERRLNELRTILAPDAFGRGGFQNRLRACETQLKIETKNEVRQEKNTEHLGKIWIAVIGLASAIAVALITNADRLSRVFREPTPAEQLARIEEQISELKKKRGPEVRKKVRDLQNAAKQMQSAPDTWK